MWKSFNGPIYLQTTLTQVQAQSDLIQNIYIFVKDKKAYNVHEKDLNFQDSFTKPHARSYAVECSKNLRSNDPEKQ